MDGLKLSALQGETILVTGATGLIGKSLIQTLLKWNQTIDDPVRILALIRNREKADRIFGARKTDMLEYVVSDVSNMEISDRNISYIVHAASQTASKAFVNEPVETILTGFEGTKRTLDLARINPVKALVYLSSMEVYGCPATDEKITEMHTFNLDSMQVRSCYPECKRICENLCASYASEYGVPIRVIRLTQTFGPGVESNDGRVFAEFARCAIDRKDIVLNTKGETKHSYLYTEDAVDAILTVMLYGSDGEAYNAANEETYCSIYDMACLVAAKLADNAIKVTICEEKNAAELGYSPTLKMNLDTAKLRGLGWNPNVNLEQMYRKMICSMRQIDNRN